MRAILLIILGIWIVLKFPLFVLYSYIGICIGLAINRGLHRIGI